MPLYYVYHHPNGRCKAVKQGFSIEAFFFGWIWALHFGLIEYALLHLLVTFAIALGGFVLAFYRVESAYLIFCVVLFAWLIWFGFKGNAWLARSLEGREYSYLGFANDTSPRRAIEYVFDELNRKS